MDLPVTVTTRGPATLAEIQHDIRARVREFEISALLDVLAAIGYGPADIVFRGSMSASPQPSLLDDIEFDPTQSRVTISVHLGLVSCRSPLPSYLLRMCREVATAEPLRVLLALLDHSLIGKRLTAERPEHMLPNWDDVCRDFLRLHGLDSPLGLQWLFRHVFPELGVHVRRTTDAYSVPFDAARLGFADLGRCAFGNRSRTTVHDLEVTLVCFEATHEGSPWPRVADLRIRRYVLPLLDEVCMNLTITCLLLDGRAYAHLSPNSYIGYDPLTGAIDRSLDPPTRVVLYRGALPHTEPDTDELEQALLAGHVSRFELAPWARDHANTIADAMPRGAAVDLHLVYAPSLRRRFVYDVDVRWGARAWYEDEPFETTIALEAVRKAAPDPRHHPLLWRWLRDHARTFIADRLAGEVIATTPEPYLVGLELIDHLIATDDREHLHALAQSGLTPRHRWDPMAWHRFMDWHA